MRVILDLDGVLADFQRGIFRHHNLPFPVPWPKGVYDIRAALGHETYDECWATVKSNFWEQLPVCPDAHVILDTIYGFTTDIHVLTGVPSIHEAKCLADPHAAYGKFLWMRKHFPLLSKRMSVTTDKTYAANPQSILIDDSNIVCARFVNHGGNAILVPRDWNTLAGHDVQTHLKRMLRHAFMPKMPETV